MSDQTMKGDNKQEFVNKAKKRKGKFIVARISNSRVDSVVTDTVPEEDSEDLYYYNRVLSSERINIK